MKRKLNVGIVGCGGIANQHVRGYAFDGRAKIASVYDVSPKAAAQLAKRTGARVAGSLKEMATRHDLDAVSICTPPVAHHACARPFLSARVPTLCEKPLAMDARAAARLAAAVRKSRTLFMTAFCHRFHPPVIELKKLIRKGVLGRPLLFRNIFAGYNAGLARNHRSDPAISGGGCLIDNGAHSVDLFRFLVGEPTHAVACVANVMQKVRVEDINIMLLEMGGRALAEITSSYSIKVGGNWVEWMGSKGTAIISYWNPGHPDLAWKLPDGEWKAVDCSKYPDRFEAQTRAFLTCVRTGRKPPVTVDDGLKAARIITAAYASAATGRRMRIR